MSESDNRRINPIVPERDGMIGGATAARSSNKTSSATSRSAPGVALGGGWKFLILALMVTSAAAAVIGWMEFSLLQSNHLALQQRFDNLESRLSSTDESVTQSGAAMQVKLSRHQDELQKHWSEIRKLWGVSNDTNRGKITKNETDIVFLAQKRVALEASMTAVSTRLEADTKRAATLSGNYLEMSGDVAEIHSKLRGLQDAQSQISAVNKRVERQLKSHSEAIESMDGFRRQTNQKLYKLEQSSKPAVSGPGETGE
jgi:chromosome segregation ATPase